VDVPCIGMGPFVQNAWGFWDFLDEQYFCNLEEDSSSPLKNPVYQMYLFWNMASFWSILNTQSKHCHNQQSIKTIYSQENIKTKIIKVQYYEL
jgi:hypothetical protein